MVKKYLILLFFVLLLQACTTENVTPEDTVSVGVSLGEPTVEILRECYIHYENKSQTEVTRSPKLHIKNLSLQRELRAKNIVKSIPKEICEETGVLQLNDGTTFDYGAHDYQCNVKEDAKAVMCDSLNDGNGDGICQSGESCRIWYIEEKIWREK